jgi:hypothetical protein
MMVLALLISFCVNFGMQGVQAHPTYHVINPISGGMHSTQL